MSVRIFRKVGPGGVTYHKGATKWYAGSGSRYFRASFASPGSLYAVFRSGNGLRVSSGGGLELLRGFRVGNTSLYAGSRRLFASRNFTSPFGRINATIGRYMTLGWRIPGIGAWVDWRFPLFNMSHKVERIDHGWQKIRVAINALGRRVLKVGFIKWRGAGRSRFYEEPGHNWTLGRRIKREGTVHRGKFGRITIAQVAAWMEYGFRHPNARGGFVEERPFMRTYMTEHREEIKRMFLTNLRSLIKTSATVSRRGNVMVRVVGAVEKAESLLRVVGWMMKDGVKHSLIAGGWKGNTVVTQIKKGFDHPLLDTGQMYEEVDWKVERYRPEPESE